MPIVLKTLLFSSFLLKIRAIRIPTTSQIAKFAKNIGHISDGGQSLPIGGTGYSKALNGKPPVAIGLFISSKAFGYSRYEKNRVSH